MPDRQFYLSKAQALCSSFSSGASPSKLASHFHPDEGEAHEHGPNNIDALPFLGRSFRGEKSVNEYFEIIQKYLKVNGEMRFSEWTVDLQPDDVGRNVGAVVTTRGRAEFEYVSTGKSIVDHVMRTCSWREEFYYRIELDKVWADPLSAYLASQADQKQDEDNKVLSEASVY